MDEDYARQATRLLSDQYNLHILAAAHNQAATVQHISEHTGVPIAVTYKRVIKLVAAGLLADQGGIVMLESNRVARTYLSLVDSFSQTTTFIGGKPNVHATLTLREKPPISLEFMLERVQPRVRQPVSPSSTDPVGSQ